MPYRSLLKFLIPATILLGASPSLAESRLALVIGQSAYKSVPALPNPANDAKAITQLESADGQVFERSRVVDIERGTPSRVHTDAGHVVTAESVVVATHAPILDAKLLVARSRASRGYALALEAGDALPDGMFISAARRTDGRM